MQAESFFCEYCITYIGHGLVIEAICHRYGPICIACRCDIINTNISEYDLSLDLKLYSIKDIEKFQKNLTSEQIEKFRENINQLKAINALDTAIGNWQEKYD